MGRHAGESELIPAVRAAARPGATVSTDEWPGYARLSWDGYVHATVNHGRRESARDDDGDGVREVHCNTMEGIWTGLRNFLRPFRGVNKVYLGQYAAIFEWRTTRSGRRRDSSGRCLTRAPHHPPYMSGFVWSARHRGDLGSVGATGDGPGIGFGRRRPDVPHPPARPPGIEAMRVEVEPTVRGAPELW